MRTFTMSLAGSINNTSLQVCGKGTCDNRRGLVEGAYSTKDGGAKTIVQFDHHVFSALVITGYPSESVSLDGAENPFRMTNHEYNRTIAAEGCGELNLEARITFDRNGNINSQFECDGNFRVPELIGVDTVVEAWSPTRSSNRIEAVFTIPWKARDGRRILGTARTTYRIPGNARMIPRTQHRIIEIQSDGNLSRFHRHQVSYLVENLSAYIRSR